MPETAGRYLKEHVKKEWRIVFLAAFLWGVAAHGYKLVNYIPNWDGLVNYYNTQDTTYLGRCFLRFACGISSYYDLPWVNGLLSVLYISGCAVCITALFRLKKCGVLILTGGMLAVFPTVASTLMYGYTSDGYFLGLLCFCLAVTLMGSFGWKGAVPGALLVMLGTGIYQAYLTFAALLVVLYLIDGLLFRNEALRKLCRQTGVFFCGFAGGLLLYGIALRAILGFSGTALSDYQGINTLFADTNILYKMKLCVSSFLEYFFDFSQGLRLFPVLNLCLALAAALLMVKALVRRRLWREPQRLLLLLLCVISMPFVSYALYFGAYVEYHSLMVMCHCLYYLFFIMLYERIEPERGMAAAAGKWGILLLSSLFLFYFLVVDNVAYQKLALAFERSYGAVLRIADRIEQTPGALECEELAVVGGFPGANEVSPGSLMPEMTGTAEEYVAWGQDEIRAMLENFFGITYKSVDLETLGELREAVEQEGMECWPSEGSLKIVDGVLVLRLSGEIKNDRVDMLK